jgi:uncharacterized protein (TIGR01244 family)
MHRLRFLAIFLFLASSVPAQEAAPDWSKRTFPAPADQVFAAALTSISAQHHEVKSKDDSNRVVTFHVGVTAWSWGYNMILKVAPGESNASNVSVEIARSGGKTVSWGSGKKEVQKIFGGIEKELAKTPALAQEANKETIRGVTNFHRLGTTVACAGATKAEAVPEIKKMGFASIINLRQASEPGADIEAEEAAAKSADIRYYHIPLNPEAPELEAANKFLDAITAQGNEPAFIHCAGGGRAATMWFIKRLVVDRWDVERAEKEAAALGMTSPALKQFALDYAQTHNR